MIQANALKHIILACPEMWYLEYSCMIIIVYDNVSQCSQLNHHGVRGSLTVCLTISKIKLYIITSTLHKLGKQSVD